MIDARWPHARASLQTIFGVLIVSAALVIGLFSPASAAAATQTAATSATTAAGVSRAASMTGTGIVKTSLAGFNPGNIISDDVFTDTSTLSATQIQSFLNSKVKTCQSGYTCLKNLKVATQTKAADSYCAKYTGSSKESAATIIYKVAKACNMNPQVLLVMLQKEQGLVTHTWPSDWRYNAAMGQACPDTAPCNVAFAGFFAQVYGAARQMQIYMEGRYFTWYKAGQTWDILYNPTRACGTSRVYIANKATEALYYYTPYQPNAAALKAGYGLGNSCSTYGNRNFYNYFTDWFGSTHQATKCAQPSGGTVSSPYAYRITAANVEGRVGPRDDCDEGLEPLEQGSIVNASVVSGSGKWLKVSTSAGYRWVSTDHVQRATAEESECTLPLGTSTAKQTYAIVTATSARLSPREGCSLDVETLQPGAVMTATEVSGSGLWLRVVTASGERWLLRSHTRSATSSEKICTYPVESTQAKYSYVLTKSASTYAAPHTSCASPGERIDAGTALQAVNAVDGWLRVETGWGAAWIDRSNTERASADEELCTIPEGLKPATQSYRPNSTITARVAPNSKCTISSTKIAGGTVLQAKAVTADDRWVQLSKNGSPVWVASSDVAVTTEPPAQVCAKPASPASAKFQYVITKATAKRAGPAPGCEQSGDIAAGTVLQAVNAVDGWLRVETGWGTAWIDRSDTKRASTSEAQCIMPEGLKTAVKSYRPNSTITARVAPNDECTTSSTKISAGTVLQATAVTADKNWLQVSAGGASVWVSRSDVDYSTAAPAPVCGQPSSPASAKFQYVITKATAKRAGPSTDCAPSGEIANGTVVQAVKAVDGWLNVTAGGTDVWIDREDTRRATTADLVCSAPAGVKPAKLDYIVTNTTATRTGPSSNCADGSSNVAVATVFSADGVSADGKWLRTEVEGSSVWVLRADTDVHTRGKSSCVVRSVGADAKLWYRAAAATGRSVPDSNCGYGTVSVANGTIVQGESVSSDGKWLKVTVDGTETWLLRSGLAKVASALTTTSLHLRSEASTSASVITTLAARTRVAVLESKGDWRRVQTLSGVGWVSAEYLR